MDRHSAGEGVRIAVDALRTNKVRAFLTILGIGIGVASVTAITAIMSGVNQGISSDLNAIGPESFVVTRFDRTQVQTAQDGKPPWWNKPKMTVAEAQALRSLPSVDAVNVIAPGQAEARFEDRVQDGVTALGTDMEWARFTRGDFIAGRDFLPSEIERAEPVTIVSEKLADQLFGNRQPIGLQLRLDGQAFRVIGVYKPAPNILQGGPPIWAQLPYTAALKYLDVDDDWMEHWVFPAEGYTQEQTMDEVTIAMRTLRRLKPGEENDFALIRQEAFANLLGKLTGVLTLVVTVLAGIGLLVGGVGVVAIMMISVTERTREIGVRKALGATRREILWQFLVESVTVTLIGGAAGMILGAGLALVVGIVTPLPARVPLWSIAASLGVAAVTGILFGLFPANKAARLDPVDALRYE